MSSIHRRALATATAVLIGAASVVTATMSGAAVAAGPNTTYLVLAPEGHSTAQAAARVAAAGGTVIANYDQIGVIVARSANPSFESAVAGAGVEASASTRGWGRHWTRAKR